MAAAATSPTTAMQSIDLALIDESPTNPRQTFDEAAMAELVESVKEHGVLSPILVRPRPEGTRAAGRFEIVYGHRRYRAAKRAGLETIPAFIRELTDDQVLEIQVVENLQREGLHELEEAEGYQQLMRRPGYDVARIAAKVGRSVKYVYDRVKLLELTDEAKRLFREGWFTAGHAIILARLSPEDQARAIGTEGGSWDGPYRDGGLFTREQYLFHPEEDDEDGNERRKPRLKPVSVREFQSWVDKHTRLEAAQVDRMLFPESAQVLDSAVAEGEKVVRITYEHSTPDEAREGGKVIVRTSWQRADGRHGSEMCEHSVIGMVVQGPARGEAFRVCVAKEKCRVHWEDRVKAIEARKRVEAKAEKQAARDGASAADREAAKRKAAEDLERKRREERAAKERRWKAAWPKIAAALVVALKKAPVSVLSKTFLGVVISDLGYANPKELLELNRYLAPGKTADDLVRYALFRVAWSETNDAYDQAHAIKQLALYGVDAKKILDDVAAAEQGKAAIKRRAPKKPARRKK